MAKVIQLQILFGGDTSFIKPVRQQKISDERAAWGFSQIQHVVDSVDQSGDQLEDQFPHIKMPSSEEVQEGRQVLPPSDRD